MPGGLQYKHEVANKVVVWLMKILSLVDPKLFVFKTSAALNVSCAGQILRLSQGFYASAIAWAYLYTNQFFLIVNITIRNILNTYKWWALSRILRAVLYRG